MDTKEYDSEYMKYRSINIFYHQKRLEAVTLIYATFFYVQDT